MTLEEYQLLAPKTVNDLTIPISEKVINRFNYAATNLDEDTTSDIDTLKEYNKLMADIKAYGLRFNMLHMAAGMAGELLEVQEVAINLMADYNEHLLSNLLEELTDIKWFCVVAAYFKGFKLTTKELDDVIEAMNEEESESFEYEFFTTSQAELLFLNKYVLELSDVIKRESCYGIAKYQKKVISQEDYKNLIYRVIAKCDIMCIRAELNPLEGMDKNIEKLHKVRYKDGFSEKAATNRDLTSEKEALNIEEPLTRKTFCNEVYYLSGLKVKTWDFAIQGLSRGGIELENFLETYEIYRVKSHTLTAFRDYISGRFDKSGAKIVVSTKRIEDAIEAAFGDNATIKKEVGYEDTDNFKIKQFCKEVYSIPKIFIGEWNKSLQSLVDKNLELEVFLDSVEKFRIANIHNTAIIDYNSGEYDEFGVENNELNTRLCTDGDNDYNIPKYKENVFYRNLRLLQSLDEHSDEYYAACDSFDSIWGEYKI